VPSKWVSIPFHSGLGYYQAQTYQQSNTYGLNPFSFRAGVLRQSHASHASHARSQSLFIQGWGTTEQRRELNALSAVSIPFHSGLGYYLTVLCRPHPELGLNPFSFRTGVLQAVQDLFSQLVKSQSLFIQGWGTTQPRLKPHQPRLSQSLFIQGWGTTHDRNLSNARICVSIPFHSGLGYY